jgi:membrane-bound lytic murein transglycosylase B
MKSKCGKLKYSFYIFVVIILFSSVSVGNEVNEIPAIYKALMDRLVQDGFDISFLSRLFSDERAIFNPSTLRIYIGRKEDPERYQKFLTKESILSAKRFLRQNLKILRRMERQFQVEKEVVVAILLVESRFGENIGRHRVIPTLASIALMDLPENIEQIYYNHYQQDGELSLDEIAQFAKRRAEWAYKELKCFFNIIREEDIDPLEIYGSYAGAIGMAQFVPSSYLLYAKAQKGLANWLLNKEEAIFSIGNYLRSHGWKKNLSLAKKKRLLWHYNNSEPYIETVIKIAQKIKS